MFFRRRNRIEHRQTREELVADLIRNGFLEQEFRLTDKSRDLLAADPMEMDDYAYWCVHIFARQAHAVVHGLDVNMAALGGPLYVSGLDV